MAQCRLAWIGAVLLTFNIALASTIPATNLPEPDATYPGGPDQAYIGLTIGGAIPAGSGTLTPALTEVNLHRNLNRAIRFGAQVGYRLANSWPVGFELEAYYVHFNRQNSAPAVLHNVTATALMANIYYNILIDNDMTPYLGAGFGYLNLDISNSNQDFSDGTFGFQMICGLAYPLSSHWHAALDYRLLGTVNQMTLKSYLELKDTRIQTINLRFDYVF